MGHDEGGPNIMQAVMTSGDPHDTGMQFRDLAREEADGYFTSKYGSSNFWPTCLNENVEKPWKDCTEEIFPDDSDAKSDEDGKCYRGKCISQAGSCIDPNTGGAIYDDGTPHTSYCDSVSDCSITYCSDGSLFGGCIGYNEPARDGMECGSGKVCRTAATDLVVDLAASPAPATSSFVDEQDLKDYHWSFGDDGCREPVCID